MPDKEIKFLKEHLTTAWGFLEDIYVVRAEGVYLHTADGKRYTDFTSGHAVCNIGHNHPAVVEAIREQAGNLIHSGGTFYYPSLYELAIRLKDITPKGLDRFFFSNSGSEVVEGAIKLARYHTGRQGIIAFTGSFHGRTYGAMSLTSSSSKYRTHYHPLLPSVYHAEYPYCYRGPGDCVGRSLDSIDYLFKNMISPRGVAAFIIEPVLGEGGYTPAPAAFLERLREICDDHGILLIFDEVQSGMGRTSRWFALEHSNVVPDIITVAKGIASGLPLSALISKPGIMDDWERGAHGTTFGGNPVACAAAAATIDVIRNEGLLKSSERLSRGVLTRLAGLMEDNPVIGDVRGLGFMIGVEFVKNGKEPDPNSLAKVRAYCFDRGLLLLDAGTERNVLRFIPPLNTTEEQMDWALTIFEDAVRSLRTG